MSVSMNDQGKVWGSTRCIFINDSVEIHRIEAKAGGYCSKHKHNHKSNAFYIEKGKLKIEVWKNDYDLIDETIITDGQMTTAKPGEFHRFTALEDTVAYEIYWTELHSGDIDRVDCGGVLEGFGIKNDQTGNDREGKVLLSD